jgi:hypothetical protein
MRLVIALLESTARQCYFSFLNSHPKLTINSNFNLEIHRLIIYCLVGKDRYVNILNIIDKIK